MCSLQLSIGILLCLFIGIIEAGKWKYSGDTGPHSWHELFPAACSGLQQSPIDIRPEMTMYNPALKDFAIWYDPPRPGSRMYVKNNGHAIQVDTVGQFFVTNGGLDSIFKVAQFHFHWGSEDHKGSEHLLDSVAHPIEMHIVTFNNDRFTDIAEAVTEKGGLAVLGVLFEVQEEPNPAFEPVITALDQVKDPEIGNTIEIEALSLRSLLPQDISKYYRYNGSLTTPGCFETVTWTVFHEKQKISFGQLLKFRRVLQHKHRKHHNHNTKHHKRSLLRRQIRQAEQHATEALDEMGIRNNPVQEGELISTLITQKHKDGQTMPTEVVSHVTAQDITHDKPAAMSQSKPAEATPTHDPINVAIEEATAELKAEKAKVEALKEAVIPTENQGVPEPVPESLPVPTEGEEWYQEELVDNFRPIQPLNDRLVHRSFKLKDIYAPKVPYVIVNPEPPKKTAVGKSTSKNGRKNSGNNVRYSVLALIAVFVSSIVL